MSEAHPAIALILEAEATPVFRRAAAPAESLLAVASQTDPESLPAPWVARLALRFADVLTQIEALDRAEQWLGIADARLAAAEPAARVDRETTAARLALRRGRPGDAQGALARARSALDAGLSATARAGRETRLAIATAELYVDQAIFAPIIPLLAPRLEVERGFAGIDDLWRLQRLLGLACHSRLDFARAADSYQACADLCAAHDAHADRADALIALGQCALALGDFVRGLTCFRDAHALSDPRADTFKGATGGLVTALLAAGDPDAALQAAKDAATQAARADDYRGYVEIVGVVTHLNRILRRHEAAYRQLLAIYGQLLQRFGPKAAEPITRLIDLLRADLGDAAFEALSARLLEERRRAEQRR